MHGPQEPVARALACTLGGDVVLDAYNFEFVEAGQTFAPTPAPTPAPPAAPAGEESDPSAVPHAVDAVLATVAGSACISAHVERDGVCQPDSACEARYASRSPAALRTEHPISLRPGHVIGTNALELVVEHAAVLNRNVTGIVLNEANAACNYPGEWAPREALLFCFSHTHATKRNVLEKRRRYAG